jgi:hypothetical protein
MTNHFQPDTSFLACGPDLEPVEVREKELADLLREHGPERLTVHVALWDGSPEELTEATVMGGADDRFKYYVTTYTSARTGLVAEIEWDV